MRELQKGVVQIFVIFGVLVLIGIVGFFILNNRSDHGEGIPQMMQEESSGEITSESSGIPGGLSLPFKIEDIGTEQGEVNPMGVIRFDEDKGHGHGGIDFPLYKDSPVFAVADGEIVRIKSAEDDWGGKGIYQLFSKKDGSGTGWAFLYEHVTPRVSVGDKVKRGDVIATKIAPNQFTAHFQLTFLFENYEYSRDDLCWPERLKLEDKNALDIFWESYRSKDIMLQSWKNIIRDGGVDLCYPMNTDAR